MKAREDDIFVTVDQEISSPFASRPHVVILGSGASKAAFPNGDRAGFRLPTFDDMIAALGLEPELKKRGLADKYSNFEVLYSEVHSEPRFSDLVALIEERVADYFGQLRLPDSPTLYDHLVLSLRPKDVIATFNWDPLLYFACQRNHEHIALPHVLYLHGNVAIGYCLKDRIKGPLGYACTKCHEPYAASKLLFPVLNKNYTMDEYINAEWNSLRHYLKSAFVFTIFGYSAPTSDSDAIDLMKQAWGPGEQRALEEVEIVDIKNEAILRETWGPFIHSHHYRTTTDFYESTIGLHPRRSVEALWTNLMDAKFNEKNPILLTHDWLSLRTWYASLKAAEGNAAN